MSPRKPTPAADPEPTPEEREAGRPKTGEAPELTAPLPILRELLETERRRLKVALRIEDERSIVFPETSVIIRDIERLLAEIERRENPQADGKPAPASPSAGGAMLRPASLESWGE